MRTAALMLGAALLLPAWGQGAESEPAKKIEKKEAKELKATVKKKLKVAPADEKKVAGDEATKPADEKAPPLEKKPAADKQEAGEKKGAAAKKEMAEKKEAAEKKESAKPEAAGGGGHFSVVELKLATEVKEREPVNPGTSFDKGATVFTWVKLNVQDPATTLTMKWYRDNTLVTTSKSIDIKKSPGYRAWLATRVAAPGSWKVEIVDADDKPVQSESFTVQ